ncbi:MAG: MutS-related protein [Bacteroidales bacterium]
MNYCWEEINKLNIGLKLIKSKRNKHLFITLVSFFALCYFACQLFSDSFSWTAIVLLFMSVAVYFYSVVRDSRLKKQRNYYQSLVEVYQNELNYRDGNFSAFDDGSEFIYKQHSFSFDLDIFGKSSLFHRINRTTTRKGKAHLAFLLSNPPTNDYSEVDRNKEALKELCSSPEFRYPFIAIGSEIEPENEDIPQSLLVAPKSSFLYSKGALLLMCFSVVISLVSAVTAYFSLIHVGVLVLLFILQLTVPLMVASKSNTEAGKIGRLHKTMYSYHKLLQLIRKQDFRAKLNENLYGSLFRDADSIGAFNELSRLLNSFDQRANAYVLVVFNGLFLRDLFLLRRFYKWKKHYASKMLGWLESIAHFDALISMAGMMYNHPDFTEATYIECGDFVLNASGLGHPFINQDKRVCNDFVIGRKQFSIITGANMAGKSTFLRTVGINYLMALCGMTVCASKFEFRMMGLFSSMRNSDDLNSGVSYFHAELNRIGLLLAECQNNEYTLLLLDEILKGTNSEDKLRGSILFLEKVKEQSVSGIIATHDLALSCMAKEYPTQFDNFRFEIALADDIEYSYQISKGVAENLNASFLLQKILDKTQ